MANPTDSEEAPEVKNKKGIKDTIRSRKKNVKANTQRYLPFAEIRNDTVILKNGGLRAVLVIEPLNFNLKSETEQMGIINGYEAFINTLIFPLQIVVRSTKVDIEPYIAHISEKAHTQKNDLLREQTLAYATFIEKIVELADIMSKKFYVIIPLDEAEKKRTAINRFIEWMNIDDNLSKAMQRNKRFTAASVRLKERVDLVDTGLRSIGLSPRRLNTMELINLYYQIYNRGQRQSQKLALGNLNTKNNLL